MNTESETEISGRLQVLNKDVRMKQIESYCKSVMNNEQLKTEQQQTMDKSINELTSLLRSIRIEQKQTTNSSNVADETTDTEDEFQSYILNLDYQQLEADENLIEIGVRFALSYVEEYDYGLKLVGLKLLTHLVDNLTEATLKKNMRIDLVNDTLIKYLNDKESLEFLDKSNELAIKCANIMECKYNMNQHYYKKHSTLVDSMLNNCYMSTSKLVKCIYLKNLKYLLTQMGLFSCRHVEKYLTVLFDSIELAKINIDYTFNKESFHLLLISLDLIKCLINECFYRIYSHSKRIIHFLLKLVYFYSQSVSLDMCSSSTSPSSPSSLSVSSPTSSSVSTSWCNQLLEPTNNTTTLNDHKLFICLKSIELVEMLFKNERIRISFYDEVKSVKKDFHLNKSFLKLIENI